MPRPTKRGVGLVAGAILLFLIGTNVQSGWLFVLASILLGGVAAGIVLPPMMIRRVSIVRRSPADAHAGDDVPVDLVLTNPSRRTLLSLSVRDEHISSFRAFVPELEPRRTLIVGTVRRAARRGIFEGPPVRISSQAPFGIASASRRVPAPGGTVIFPRVVPIHWLPGSASAARPLQAATVLTRKGAGQDFIGIREYQLGDSLRHVHWPSTAKHGAIMVREFEQELPRRMGMILDSSADTGGEETALDICCSVAGSLALHALAGGQPLAMTSTAGPSLDSVDSISDPTEVEALTWLAGLEAPGSIPFPEIVKMSAPILGRLDTVIAVFPTWRENTADRLLPQLTAFREVQVLAVVVDAASFDGAPRGRTLSATEIDDLDTRLQAAGVIVHRVSSGDDLIAAMER